MKTKLFGAALIACAAAAGAAHANEGSVGVSYQSTDYGSSSIETAAINGAVELTDNLQINARYADFDGEANAWGIDGFLSQRNDSYGYGAFLGYSSFDGEGDEWSIGGFGQLYRGNTNWTAQLGYSDTEGEISIIHLDGEARFFLNENFSLQANLGYGDLDSSGGGGTDYWSGGVGAEWQIPGSHVSLNGGWQHVEFDGGDIDTLGAGIRFHFNGGTLIERSRTGASLRRATPTLLELELGGSNTGYSPR